MEFGTLLSDLMTERGLGVRALARRVPCDPALISRLASGRQQPSSQIARRLDEILAADGELSDLALLPAGSGPVPGDEIGAIEVGRRASASEVGSVTIEQ